MIFHVMKSDPPLMIAHQDKILGRKFDDIMCKKIKHAKKK